MTLDERLAYFSEQVNCVRPIYTWQYGSTGQLLKSNCPCEAVHPAGSVQAGSCH